MNPINMDRVVHISFAKNTLNVFGFFLSLVESAYSVTDSMNVGQVCTSTT